MSRFSGSPASGEGSQSAIIAIDGPAASGKSVVGKLLAERLGYRFLDTGAMYRAVTWLALQKGVDNSDETTLGKLASTAAIEINPVGGSDGRPYTVRVNGQDITWELRSADVEANVSAVSKVPAVRQALVAKQRALAQKGNIVMVGRDIGTVVLPNAALKVYLEATAEERASRRQRELAEHGDSASYEVLLAAIRQRDQLDSERVVSPLRPAEDATIVHTDGLTVSEVVAKIEALFYATVR